MSFRLPATPSILAWSLLILLAACAGPTGPEGPAGSGGVAGPAGPAGPGTRLVFGGVVGAEEFVAHDLPIAAGTVASPPVATCWISEDNVFWFSDLCIMSPGNGGALSILMVGAQGWLYRIVVVY
jgi:hypothetical protein